MEKKLVEIQNGGPDLFDETCKTAMLRREDKQVFAQESERTEGPVMCSKIRLSEGEQNKKCSNMQVEI